MFCTQLICCRTGTSKLPEMRQRMTWKKLYIAGSYAPYSYYWCLYREFTVKIFTRIPLFRMSPIRSILPRCKPLTIWQTRIFSMKKVLWACFQNLSCHVSLCALLQCCASVCVSVPRCFWSVFFCCIFLSKIPVCVLTHTKISTVTGLWIISTKMMAKNPI